MIELTHSDAMTYCLSVAQIIPVFLIALSVLDNGRVTRRIERTKKESVKIEERARKWLSSRKKERQELKRSLEEIDTQIAALDSIDPSQASDEAVSARDITRLELMELRANREDFLKRLMTATENMRDLLDRAPNLRQDLDTARRSIVTGFGADVVFGIFLVTLAEIIALWGAIGLLSSIFAIATITNFSIVIIGVLGVFAVDRLMDESNPRLTSFIQIAWLTIMVGVAQLTFIMILSQVKVAH
jgi:hypothetical protein